MLRQRLLARFLMDIGFRFVHADRVDFIIASGAVTTGLSSTYKLFF